MKEKLKIAIVDDHEMFRSGIKMILSQKEDWEVVIEAVNGLSFLKKLEYILPDVILMDISMPELNGYDTTVSALQKYPDLKIIILTMFNEEHYYLKMIEAGVKGFIQKATGVNELFRSIEEVAKGNNYFAQDLLKSIVFKIKHKDFDDKIQLTDREKEVLHFICNGYTNKEISEKICLGIKSIEKYRHNLIKKSGANNSSHLVMLAIKNQLINL
ncbi:MAG: response regulator [Bacteroidales bacterium]|nr:response regulator [Bacteroidales bacterium]